MERSVVIRNVLIIVIVTIVIAAATVIWTGYAPGDTVVINDTAGKDWDTTIYIGGMVNLPGYYPCRYDDSLESVILAAGGLSANGTVSELTLTIRPADTGEISQKIDINRAESWLLQALPGIGEVLAERIVLYRQEHGPFANCRELFRIEGIGPEIFGNIEAFITVSDR